MFYSVTLGCYIGGEVDSADVVAVNEDVLRQWSMKLLM
jgi:hypothetical protein